MIKSIPKTIFIPIFMFAGIVALAYSVWFNLHPDALAMGITLDLTMTIPVVWFLAIRKTNIPNITVIPAFVIGLFVSGLILPKDHLLTHDQIKLWVLPLVELGALTFIFFKIRAINKRFNINRTHHFDFYNKLQTAIKGVIPSPADVFFATEIAVFYFAFFSWKKPDVSEKTVSYHKESGAVALLYIILLLVLVETFVFHVLLMQWSATAAWVLSGISIYTGIQVLSFARSLSKRPIYLDENNLILRFGILSEVSISYSNIKSLSIQTQDLPDDKSIQKLSPLGSLDGHNIILRLEIPVVIKGFYNLNKKAQSIAFFVDDPALFKAIIDQKLSSD